MAFASSWNNFEQESKDTMKTILITLAILFYSLSCNAQNENWPTSSVAGNSQASFRSSKLTPVYFHFRKRQLRDMDKNLIQPIEFLNLCRSINDSAIQYQVARYDTFTKEKQTIGVVALGSGFVAIGLLGAASMNAAAVQKSEMVTGTLAFFGVIGVLIIPVAAIYSSVPHQRRKSVLFRDLPVAYNHYVEAHSNN